MRTFFTATIAVAGCLAFAGCATQAPVSPPVQPAAGHPRPVAMTFGVSGRIAARDSGDTRRGFSGSFNWKHTPADDIVELITPLGQVVARVTMTPAGTVVETGDGKKVVTPDPEKYVLDTMGVSLPLSSLSYWMQGVPVPGARRVVENDAVGRPSVLFQHGWQIRYGEYAGPGPDARPTRIDISQGAIEARILIGEWTAT